MTDLLQILHNAAMQSAAQTNSRPYLKELHHIEFRVGLLLLCGSFTEQLRRIHLVPIVVLA